MILDALFSNKLHERPPHQFFNLGLVKVDPKAAFQYAFQRISARTPSETESFRVEEQKIGQDTK